MTRLFDLDTGTDLLDEPLTLLSAVASSIHDVRLHLTNPQCRRAAAGVLVLRGDHPYISCDGTDRYLAALQRLEPELWEIAKQISDAIQKDGEPDWYKELKR